MDRERFYRSINVVRHSAFGGGRGILTKHPFFKGTLIVKVEEDRVVFTKPTLGYRGPTINFSKAKSGWFRGTITGDIPLGRLDFDEEESNEDCIVVYFKQNTDEENDEN